MARNAKTKRKRAPKTILKLPDLEQSKSVVLNSLTSPSSQRSYDHAIREFIDRYCSEPRLAFNKTVVTRYRISLEQRHYAPSTINLRLAAVRRARVRGFRLRPPESRSGRRHSQGKGRSPARRSDRQLADCRRGQAPHRCIWRIDSEGAEEPGHDRGLDRLRPEKGGSCCLEAGRCSTPGRTLGDRPSEWKGRSHPHGSNAGLGEAGNRRMDSVCWTHFRTTVPSHQQGRPDMGKWIHAEGDLVNR
jgi:hypothetical protein